MVRRNLLLAAIWVTSSWLVCSGPTVVSAVAASPTTGSAMPAYAYDVPAAAHVDVQVRDLSEIASAQILGLRERPASLLALPG